LNSLDITIAGKPFSHMLYHFVLPYSNWETGTICYSESFESLSEGSQNAFWGLGGIPRYHQTDSLSTAVHKADHPETFTHCYRSRLPQKVNTFVSVLLEGNFTERSENVLAFGNPGSGKTHLLCAIGQELIHLGKRVLFTTCSLLVQQLLIAKRELELARVLKRLSRYDVLIIDDIGYVQQSRAEMEVLFTLLADRYERGSIMLTSNLPFSKWEQIFKDPMTTAAAIDRLVHHSVILELNVNSYRLEKSKGKKQANTT